ncbi:hypothetical protein GOP47_0025149 [Adiantum capillus-veneris]|uniref:Uncharacterized protein n=1 Tax=Adiantum capillus-veneris TaxID=13818 RepID=A0A9D4Z4A2_ADICA|nr:hypothetical protein GOP47_0025149 [Adiantum capillus-veneris]
MLRGGPNSEEGRGSWSVCESEFPVSWTEGSVAFPPSPPAAAYHGKQKAFFDTLERWRPRFPPSPRLLFEPVSSLKQSKQKPTRHDTPDPALQVPPYPLCVSLPLTLAIVDTAEALLLSAEDTLPLGPHLCGSNQVQRRGCM